jgi:hypothetical protein
MMVRDIFKRRKRTTLLAYTLRGLIAGAAGTVALDIATYADMAIRGRPSSSAPSKMVSRIASTLHLPLFSARGHTEKQMAQQRESGLGALLGYINGLGSGVGYGLLRSQIDDLPLPLAAVAVALAAMAASDVPLVILRVSNPKTWGVSGWMADLIPHLIYGLVTTATYEALSDSDVFDAW